MINTKKNKIMFSEEDLSILSKITNKSVESIKSLIEKNKNFTDYDILNKLSSNRGSETYHRLMNDKIQSLEYTNGFGYIKNHKTFNLNTIEGMKNHIYRNKNQYGKAPKDLETMYKFVEAGYFIFEGYSPCHNLREEDDNLDGRYASLSKMIYLYKNKLLYKPNKYSYCGNISFRGVASIDFEGCQFIYNDKTGKLVCDNLNRGTFDFGKYATTMHYFMDILPWLKIGNGNNVETEDLFIMSDDESERYLTDDVIKHMNKRLDNVSNLDVLYKLLRTYFNKNDDIISSKEALIQYKNELKRSKEDFIHNYIYNEIGIYKFLELFKLDINSMNYLKYISDEVICGYQSIHGSNHIDLYTENGESVNSDSLMSENVIRTLIESLIEYNIKHHVEKDTEYEYRSNLIYKVEFYDITKKEIESTATNEEYNNDLIRYRANELLKNINEALKDFTGFKEAHYPIVLELGKQFTKDGFTIDIHFKHKVSEFEALYCNGPHLERYLKKFSISNRISFQPIENSEELTTVH